MQRNGRTEAEADTASILAAALAEKHGIDIAGLDQADDQRRAEITHREVGHWAKTPPEADYASLICKRFFEVSPLSTHKLWLEQIVFIGTPLHIDLAEYVFKFLVHEFRWQWNKKRGRCKNRKQFIYGCYQAVFTKLYTRFLVDAPEETSALELSFKARREAYMKEQFGETKSNNITPKNKTSAALNRGWHAGQDIELRPGVAAGNSKAATQLEMPNGRLLTNG